MSFGIAVKSFIVNDEGELLLIKRRDNDVHKPGVWEVPGGRLEKGEDIEEGLKRETKEETGLKIKIVAPLKVHHIKRKDGQKIRMTTFFCRLASNASVRLSEEHTEHCWIKIEEAKSKITPFFKEEIELFQRLNPKL